MPDIQAEIAGVRHLPGAEPDQGCSRQNTSRGSFLEQFLNSFFQEKNIKWMLVVGAAIVFGSSLMLVTKAWPNWPSALKFLTILSYTGMIFLASEVCRKQLRLTATYKVLHSLTLLLLPVCFLALQWLTAGTATQSWNLVTLWGLLLPATAFLWFAASRVLDHLLRGRQTTFLLSFCVLCLAGALPPLTTPAAAFAFMTVCWVVLTAGIVKVNRHTFWLAEEFQRPRIFGFVPIMMLGLQFVVLIGTKAITAIPVQWTGFGCVMLAATVLLTARAVADVLRQRTGDLVRPLPWHVVLPIFSGLVLTALGLALSFRGFTYVGPTTFAVIPTALVAAVLMGLAARDTRQSGFVWAAMICTAVAYQCCPTMFAELVQALKQSAATAINRERVPFSLYGITYLPLLAVFAAASRRFAMSGSSEFSQPLKHFVTVVGLALFVVALSDSVSLLFVSLTNTLVFAVFAITFRDRRYIVPSLAGLVLATGIAIPAMNSMQYTDIGSEWIATALAALAAVLTATKLPDRIIRTIPLPQNSPPELSSLAHPAGLLGGVLALVTAAEWIGYSLFHFSQPVTQAAVLQYAFLMTAFVMFTLRNPRYLPGFCFWSLAAFAAIRWASGLDIPVDSILAATCVITAGTSLLSYVWLRFTSGLSAADSVRDLRSELGIDTRSLVEPTNGYDGGWIRQAQAFVVPLCDLSLAILSCLAVLVQLPRLIMCHLPILGFGGMPGQLWLSTSVTVLWLAVAARVFRSRTAGVAAAMALPLWITAAILSSGIALTAAWCCVAWAAVQAITLAPWIQRDQQRASDTDLLAVDNVRSAWLQFLLLGSCLSFNPVLRLVAVIVIGTFLLIDRRDRSRLQAGYLAVAGNLHLLLLAGAAGGCQGIIVTVLLDPTPAAIPLVLLASAISVAVFDALQKHLEPVLIQTWTAILRTGMLLLAVLSLNASLHAGDQITVMVFGFAIATATEVMQAVRQQRETYVWSACAGLGLAALFLFAQGVIVLGAGVSQFVLLGISVMCLLLAHLATCRPSLFIIRRPMHRIGQSLPLLVVGMAVVRSFFERAAVDLSPNAMALMVAAGIYFQQAMVTRRRRFAGMAAAILNVGLMLQFQSLNWTALEFYLVPVGLSVLAFVELLKKELPAAAHDPLRYIGALTILVSPMFEVLNGSWVHMFTLMVISVLVILAAIGLRIRVLVYAGSAFLLTDLVAMVVHSTIANPMLLWVGGIALGIGVIVLAAVCENHREKLLTRIRLLTAELATWN